MGKGMLMEVDRSTGIVLTPQGEFKRVDLPKGSWQIGDEVTFPETRPMGRWGWVAAAAAVLMLLASPLAYQGWALAQPLAMVMVDINPSMQLTVNQRSQVIAAEGLNEDGRAVLAGVQWKRRPVDAVLEAMTAKAAEAGKLNVVDDASAVVVAVAPVPKRELTQEQADQLAAQARSAIENEVKSLAAARGSTPQTHVAVLEASADEVTEAAKEGLTLPKLLILREVQAEQPDVDASVLKQQGPGQFLKGLGLSPGEIFGRAEKHHNRTSGDDGPTTPATGNGAKESGQPNGDRGPTENNGNGNNNGNGQGLGNGKDQSPGNGNGNGQGNGKENGKGQDSDKGNGNGKNNDQGNPGGRGRPDGDRGNGGGSRGNSGSSATSGDRDDGRDDDSRDEQQNGNKGGGNGNSGNGGNEGNGRNGNNGKGNGSDKGNNGKGRSDDGANGGSYIQPGDPPVSRDSETGPGKGNGGSEKGEEGRGQQEKGPGRSNGDSHGKGKP